MPRLISIRPVYCMFVTSLFVLGGCQSAHNSLFSSGAEVTTSQSLEEPAAGDVVVTKGNSELSPIEQHMLARGDVNPKKVNRKNKFSKTVDDYKKIEEERERELNAHLNAKSTQVADAGNLKIETDPIKRQESAKSYVETILERHKARQEGAEMDVLEDEPQEIVVSKSVPKPVERVTATSRVSDVRIGQHPGKTRIVIDVSDKTKFQTSFKDGDRTLVVNIPSTSWDTENEANVAGESVVKGYSSVTSTSGAVVNIALNAPGKLAYKKALGPSSGRGHRIVLDIVAR